MILSIFEYGDIIYSGTSNDNLRKLDRLFFRGLRTCIGSQYGYSELELCRECSIASLTHRRHMHLLLFMHKQKYIENMLKKSTVNTRLHMAPVFWYYKPNNEKARLNSVYKGAIEWNSMPANTHNLDFKEF